MTDATGFVRETSLLTIHTAQMLLDLPDTSADERLRLERMIAESQSWIDRIDSGDVRAGYV